MMKFVVVLALVAAAVAGPVNMCTTLENADWEDANTIEPWLVNSYLGGSDACANSPDNLQCQLLQQNAVNFGAGLNNAGRISVGQLQRPRTCRTEGQVGMNVYQKDIGMCRGNTLSIDIGYQDSSNNNGRTRVDNYFALIVGRDNFDIMGGTHTVVAEYTFPALTERPYNEFQQTKISGVWNGPAGDNCSPICPTGDRCFVVGLRYARDMVVSPRVRGYTDNLENVDGVDPVIVANDVSAMAASCGAATFVSFDTSATDNCCATVLVEYSWGSQTWTTTASGSFTPGTTTVSVRATDNSGNIAMDSFVVSIAEFKPSISCDDYAAETQSCWTELPSETQTNGLAEKIGACGSSSAITYSPTLDSMFRNGITVVTATYTQPDELGGTYTLECTSNVQFTLCCQADNKKRSTAPLRKLAKF